MDDLKQENQKLKEKNSQMESALGYALEFLEDLPSPPLWIIEEINNCLEIEY